MDSIQRPPEENTAEAIQRRIGLQKNPKERTRYQDLPTWVRTAFVLHDVVGLTWKQVARRVNKAPSTIQGYKQSPAVRLWRKELAAHSNDAKLMAETVMQASALGVTLDVLIAFQKAVDAGDYKETGKMGRDLLDRIGIQKKEPKTSRPNVIVLQMPGSGGSMEIPMVQTSYQLNNGDEDAPDYEVVSADD